MYYLSQKYLCDYYIQISPIIETIRLFLFHFAPQILECFKKRPPPRNRLGYEMKFCKFVYSCVQATASDKFMHSIKNVKLILAKELGRGV